MEAKKVSEPPREVWVVSDGSGQAEFVSNVRESANDHANEAAGGLPEEGPYRLCRYVAEPFANAAPDLLAAPYTLRFIEWRCGHHGTRPADIPVHSIEQAESILWAIASAISQPGNARAAIFDDTRGTVVYLTDDYVELIPQDWSLRTIVYHGTAAEIAELLGLQAAWDYVYGGTLPQWDGTTRLDDMEVITSLDVAAIEAAIAPPGWYEERIAVCDVPPILKPASELLAELREAADEMRKEGGAA